MLTNFPMKHLNSFNNINFVWLESQVLDYMKQTGLKPKTKLSCNKKCPGWF